MGVKQNNGTLHNAVLKLNAMIVFSPIVFVCFTFSEFFCVYSSFTSGCCSSLMKLLLHQCLLPLNHPIKHCGGISLISRNPEIPEVENPEYANCNP